MTASTLPRPRSRFPRHARCRVGWGQASAVNGGRKPAVAFRRAPRVVAQRCEGSLQPPLLRLLADARARGTQVTFCFLTLRRGIRPSVVIRDRRVSEETRASVNDEKPWPV